MANYSQQDFISTYEDLLEIVASSTTKWDPRTTNESDPGLIILKLLALLEDKFNYKFDMAVAQGYIDTVSDIESAQDLFRMLGYTMKSARASQGTIGIKPKEALTGPQLIPHHSFITNNIKTVKFFTLNDVTITPGTIGTTYIQVVSGEPSQITKAGINEFVLKDIDEDGRLALGRTGLAQNGVFVYTVNGDNLEADWTYQDLLLATIPGTKYYTVSTFQGGENYIQFPKDFESLIGGSKLVIYATYTEGTKTNISRNTLSKFEDSGLDQLFYISQTEDFENGQDSESIKQAEINYYKQKDLCNTIISKEDFREAILLLADQITGKRFSNVIVNTAQDRALKVISKYDNKSFYKMITSDEPAYQIDVTPLTNKASYKESFKTVAAEALGAEEGIINTELSNLNSVFTTTKVFNNAQGEINSNPINARLLAVTKPVITVQISGYTEAKAITIKQSVRNALYSRFRANYLAPGEALDYNEIIDIIKRVSSAVRSVSMDRLSYDIYLQYGSVDGTAIAGDILAISNDSIRTEIIKRAVLSGAVPLFRYSNRPNTLSKKASMYTSLLASSQAVEQNALEVTVPIPFGAKETTPISEGAQINPVIAVTELTGGSTSSEPIEGENYSEFILSDNLLFQTRKQQFRDSAIYGSGMTYLFFSVGRCTLAADTDVAATILLKTTKLKAGSTINSTVDTTMVDPEGATINISEDTDYTFLTDVTITAGSLTLNSATLKVGSEICPGSSLGGTPFNPYINANGIDYELMEEEQLIIADSTGAIKARLAVGEVFSTEGLGTTFYVSGIREPGSLDFSGTSFNATQSITTKEGIISTIDLTKYNYILSRPTPDNLVLTQSGYMLEEDEFFVYTDLSKTEYVMIGPGTVLKSHAGITLKSTPLASVEDVNDKANFTLGTGTMTFSSYEITTEKTDKTKILIKRSVPGSSIMTNSGAVYKIAEEWKSFVKGDTVIVKNYIDGEWKTKETLTSSLYDARLVGLIFSDEFGVAKLPKDTTLTIGGVPMSDSSEEISILASSVPFKKFLTGVVGAKLFSEGVTAQLTMTYAEDLQSTNFASVIGADYISLTSLSSTAQSIIIPLINGTRVYANLSMEVPQSSVSTTITIKGATTPAGELNQLIYPLSFLTEDQGGKDITNSQAEKYIKKEVTIDLSGLSKIQVSLGGSSLAGVKVLLSKLSYVEDFSTELDSASTETLLAVGNLQTVLDTLKTTLKDGAEDPTIFNWLDYPREELTQPLEAERYFNRKHPFNKNTFPYIELIDTKIKVIGDDIL